MHDDAGTTDDLGTGGIVVPLFPLPNVVLFPNAVLPLHIFEERYKEMTADALDGSRRIAMALLTPGWEKDYHSRPAIEPVVCVGRILTHERLSDGRYNFLLQGLFRAKIVRELSVEADGSTADRMYRLAKAEPVVDLEPEESTLVAARHAFHLLFNESPLGETPIGRKFAELTASKVSTPDLADLVAFNFVEDVQAKQGLLAEPDVTRRLAMLLHSIRPMLQPRPRPTGSRFGKPSLN